MNLSNKTLAAALALALAASLPAAAEQKLNEQRQSRATAGGRYDQQIRADLEKKFKNRKEFQGVKYTVEDGVVTLTGNVELFAHKQKADERAHDVDHVQGVSNRIQVAGQTVTDAQLQEKLADKLRYDRISQGIVFNSLSIGVKNGVVEVHGTVIDEPSRASALAIVANMPGVKGVRDEIEVAPVSGHDDELRIRLAREIYGALPMYANDPQAPIRIVVNRGHVTLEGVVNSTVDKQTAYMRASSVPGAFSVTNNLIVAGRESAKN